MCGIAGTVNLGDEDVLHRMVSALGHRGPDDAGLWQDRSSRGTQVWLGHRRLSILDLTPAGHQPMSSKCGAYTIVYNGEIYNYRELRGQLEKQGSRFTSRSDTEVILELYGRHGIECLQYLRGMFAFALWDSGREELILVRDRMGIKPLFYAEAGIGLAFGSELKTILLCDEVDTGIDCRALDDYLTYLYIPPPRTIFRGARELAPAHYTIWRDGRLGAPTRYWDLPAGQIEGTEDELVEQARAVLMESVRLHMVSDVPVGAFLSGGLDSSSIVALMAREANAPLKTFSIGFGRAAQLYDELEHARFVAEEFGTDHSEFIVEPNVAELLPEMIRAFDQPFGNPTALLVHLLSGCAGEQVKVVLAGDGGDELFGGYPRYRGAMLSEHYRQIPGWLRAVTADPVAELLPESATGRHGLRRFKEFVRGCRLPPEQMYCSWVAYYTDDLKDQLYGEDLQQQREDPPYAFLRGQFDHARGLGKVSLFDQATAVDLCSFLPCNLLAYTDRMSMAHGLEVRVPFVDHELVEFAVRLPTRMRLRGRTSKYLLRRACEDLLPRKILRRRKLGFNPPMGLWLKGELRPLIQDCLSPEAVKRRGYFEAGAVEAMIDQQMSGRRDLSLQLWALIVLEIWHRLLGR